MGVTFMDISETYRQLLNWYGDRFPLLKNNLPTKQSQESLEELCSNILIPIKNEFGPIEITYGYTSPELLRLIKSSSIMGISPGLDQHSSCEENNHGNLICSRKGAACDFVIKDTQVSMFEIAKWIIENLPFDRIYLYGKNRPVHISYGPENSRFIQIMSESNNGRRYPAKNASGDKCLTLINEAISHE